MTWDVTEVLTTERPVKTRQIGQHNTYCNARTEYFVKETVMGSGVEHDELGRNASDLQRKGKRNWSMARYTANCHTTEIAMFIG